MTVSRVMPCRIEFASRRRVDHAVADQEQILAGAFAHRAVDAQADAFGEAEPLRFHADQLARQVVAGGLAERRNRVRREPLPRRHADVDAVLQSFGAEVGAPLERRDRRSRPAAGSSARRRSHRSRETRTAAGTRRGSVRWLTMISLHAALISSGVYGNIDAIDLRRVEQAPRVIAQPEDRDALRRRIGPLTLEHRRAVVQGMRQHVDCRFFPGHQLAVVPDVLRLR